MCIPSRFSQLLFVVIVVVVVVVDVNGDFVCAFILLCVFVGKLGTCLYDFLFPTPPRPNNNKKTNLKYTLPGTAEETLSLPTTTPATVQGAYYSPTARSRVGHERNGVVVDRTNKLVSKGSLLGAFNHIKLQIGIDGPLEHAAQKAY